MKYHIDNMGLDTYHSNRFEYSLPNGYPFWIFLHLITPFVLNDRDGMKYADAGACILYPPNYPRYLHSPEGQDALCNNWIHFACSDDDAFRAGLLEYGVPLCRLFTLRQTSLVVDILKDLTYEFTVRPPHSDKAVNALLDTLMIQLSRNLLPYEMLEDKDTLQHIHHFERLRKAMYTSPEKNWCVQHMAKEVYLGKNQFLTLYSRFFSVSPWQDLIDARIEKAKKLLVPTVGLRDVALSCGFRDEFYFSTVFKKKVGICPSRYAQGLREAERAPGLIRINS